MLLKEIRSSDDLDRQWPVETLLDAVLFPSLILKCLTKHFSDQQMSHLSLRDFIEFFIGSDPFSLDDYGSRPVLRVRNIGRVLYRKIFHCLSKCDFGSAFHAEWYTRTESIHDPLQPGPIRPLPDNVVENNPGLGLWSVLVAYRGSIAHGMFVPGTDPHSVDDRDIMAVCLPPLNYYFGLKEFGSRGTQEIKQGEWDIVVFELKKFIRLLSRGNPNVLAMLWLKPAHYLKLTEIGRHLLAHRDLFVGRHVYHSFSGYAHSQLHRMTHLAFKGYMGEKRKGLVEKFGYDTKNAAHLIRLLRMAIEFLKDGVLQVEREDASELLAIKRGEWTLDQVKVEADRLFPLAQEAYDQSDLPQQPDREKIDRLCTEMLEMRFASSGSRKDMSFKRT